MSRGTRKTIARRDCVLAAALGWLIAILAAAAAQAQTTIIVDTNLDDSGAGHCTLREAINSATGIGDTGSCATGGGPFTINFSASLASESIVLGSALPTITSGANLTINGPATAPGITIDGNKMFRVLSVGSSFALGATLALNNLTIAHGEAQSGGVGGGVFVETSSELTATNCTFLDNSTSDDSGGAIAVNDQALATVVNSTFTGNKAHGGGAILNLGSLTVTSSTFYGNRATGTNGGGILTGIHGVTNLKSSILATNSPGDNCFTVRGAFNDDGYNLSDDDSCDLGGIGSRNGVKDTELKLGTIADNGGPTATIALQTGSVAIDAIPQTACTYPAGLPNPCATTGSIPDQLTCDQRGQPRPDPEDGPAGNCDIGAYEYQASTIDCSRAAASTPNLVAISPRLFFPETISGVRDLKGSFKIGITSVMQDKPVPRNLCPNAAVFGTTTFVRTTNETAQGPDGLLYSIGFKATDARTGASCTGAVPVCVQDIFFQFGKPCEGAPSYDATKCP